MSTTRLLAVTEPDAVDTAKTVLEAGGVVALPTDTVYGVGVPAHNVDGIRRLYSIKGRDAAKAIPVLIAAAEDLEEVAQPDNRARKLAAAFWPGALTLVLPRQPHLPEALSPYATIGVRVPDHPVALTLLRAVGPMAVTSANRSGEPDSLTAAAVLEQLGGRIDMVLDGGPTPGGQPSTVVEFAGKTPKVLRSGPISEAEIRGILA